MKILIFFMFCGVISINLALFYGQGTDLKNIFGVAVFKYFWGVPDTYLEKLKVTSMGSGTLNT